MINGGPDNTGRSATDRPSEAELLDVVEGGSGALDEGARRRVARAVAADPALAAQLAAMRVDRAALMAMAPRAGERPSGEAAPLPVAFLDAIDARLERGALARLAAAEPASVEHAALPRMATPSVRVHGHGVLGRIGAAARDRRVRPFLLAAGLALALSVAFVGVRSAIEAGTFRGDANLARGGHGATDRSASGNTARPVAVGVVRSPGDSTFEGTASATAAATGKENDTALVSAAPEPTIAELALLARERRLAIVVRDDSPARTRSALLAWARSTESLIDGDRIAAIEPLDRRDQPSAFTALAALVPVPAGAGGADPLPPRQPLAPIVADDVPDSPGDVGAGVLLRGHAPFLFTTSNAVEPDIVLARLDPAEARLSTALGRLIDQLRGEGGRSVRFAVLDRPAVPEPPPSTDDLLWWTLPPARWVAPTTVPVIIEPQR